MYHRALEALLVLIIRNYCLADDPLCVQRIQQYGQAKYCSYYSSQCPTACSAQPTTASIPPAPGSGGEPASCTTNAAQYGKAYYCSFYAAQCPLTCGSGGGGSGTCPNDYPKCNQMIQTYGNQVYCSYYAQWCPGPCKLPCGNAAAVSSSTP